MIMCMQMNSKWLYFPKCAISGPTNIANPELKWTENLNLFFCGGTINLDLENQINDYQRCVVHLYINQTR